MKTVDGNEITRPNISDIISRLYFCNNSLTGTYLMCLYVTDKNDNKWSRRYTLFFLKQFPFILFSSLVQTSIIFAAILLDSQVASQTVRTSKLRERKLQESSFKEISQNNTSLSSLPTHTCYLHVTSLSNGES